MDCLGNYCTSKCTQHAFIVTYSNIRRSCISHMHNTESPGPPSDVRVSNVTNTSAVLSWSPPDNGGGRSLYEIVYTVTATGECVCLSYPSKLPYTVQPPNKGHYGANDFVPCREVIPMSEVKQYTKVLAWG